MCPPVKSLSHGLRRANNQCVQWSLSPPKMSIFDTTTDFASLIGAQYSRAAWAGVAVTA